MGYTIDLSSARAKLDRARVHIKALRNDAGIKEPADAIPVPLRWKYEPEERAIIWRIESVVQASEYWGLLVGDAAHNLRCALDHVAWQLALKHLYPVEPSGEWEIKKIKFPVVLDINKWDSGKYWKFMCPDDAAKLKDFQPFNFVPSAKQDPRDYHPFAMLGGFDGVDNVDKHRAIHLTVCAMHETALHGSNAVPIDCEFAACYVWGNMPGGMIPYYVHTVPGDSPQPGDEILRVPVIVTGPNPQVKFETSLTVFIKFRESLNVLTFLDTVAEGVRQVIERFA